MRISRTDASFDSYRITHRVPPQRWWQRLFFPHMLMEEMVENVLEADEATDTVIRQVVNEHGEPMFINAAGDTVALTDTVKVLLLLEDVRRAFLAEFVPKTEQVQLRDIAIVQRSPVTRVIPMSTEQAIQTRSPATALTMSRTINERLLASYKRTDSPAAANVPFQGYGGGWGASPIYSSYGSWDAALDRLYGGQGTSKVDWGARLGDPSLSSLVIALYRFLSNVLAEPPLQAMKRKGGRCARSPFDRVVESPQRVLFRLDAAEGHSLLMGYAWRSLYRQAVQQGRNGRYGVVVRASVFHSSHVAC
jgi:hypothetical protein